MILIFLAALAVWFGYKKARDTGRNAILWGVFCGAAFIGAQLLVAIGIGVFIAIGIELWGWSEELYVDSALWITIASVVAGFVTLLFIFKFLDRIPEEPSDIAPPPPPTFGQDH